MICACKANIRYEASGDTIKVILDKIDWCPLHGAAGDLLAALERAITYQHDPSMWVEQARVTVQKAEVK